MKKKKEKPKKVNESSDKKNKDKKKELEVKQVGTLNGFVIFVIKKMILKIIIFVILIKMVKD